MGLDLTAPLGRERAALWGVLSLAVLGCALALVEPPPAGPHGEIGAQLLDLVRVLATVALAVSLLLGPGLAWRALTESTAPRLAFLPLPGLLLLAATGGLAWALAGGVDPRQTCFAVLAPVLAALAACLLRAGPAPLLEPAERRCLLVVGAVLGIAVARALWSQGPEGELYSGTVSRTLAVGDRPDSRISFILPQLIAHDAAPYGEMATAFYAPYNFSSRGPLSGLASAPLILISGGKPPAALPEQGWAPFDSQGFMAYRIAMMAFAATAFVSLWGLVRQLAGAAAARFALLLAAGTPFLVHEVWFTWPKLLAASFVLLAALALVGGHPFRAGLLVGLGYLMHPVALVSLPVLAAIALWPLRAPRWRRPRLGALGLLAAGTAILPAAWRLLNGDRFMQSGFTEYLTQAGWNFDPSLGEWASYRVDSLANTLVPLFLPLSSGDNYSVNSVFAPSPPAIHFFFQYWNTVAFGFAIVFLPLLALSLWRAARRWPWPFAAVVAIPFLAFAVYWGASSTGMMREGLQAWALLLLAVVACQQAAEGFPWLRAAPLRALLSLRPFEVLLAALGPALATDAALIGPSHRLTDLVALAAMAALTAALALLVWRWREPGTAPGNPRSQGRRRPAGTSGTDTLAPDARAGNIPRARRGAA